MAPNEGDWLLRSKVENALEANRFVRAINRPEDGIAIWDCHFAPGAEVVLDLHRDWLSWDELRAQLVDQGFPTEAIAGILDE